MRVNSTIFFKVSALFVLFWSLNSTAVGLPNGDCVATADIFNTKDTIRVTHQQADVSSPTVVLRNLEFRIVNQNGVVPMGNTQGHGYFITNLGVNASKTYTVQQILALAGISTSDHTKYYIQILQLGSGFYNDDFQAVYISNNNYQTNYYVTPLVLPLIFTCPSPVF